jgi:hypothetical protein
VLGPNDLAVACDGRRMFLAAPRHGLRIEPRFQFAFVAADHDGSVAEPVGVAASDEQLIEMLVERARSEGMQLTGAGGLLQQLTKRVLESALEGEITDHLGYDKHDPVGKNSGNTLNAFQIAFEGRLTPANN